MRHREEMMFLYEKKEMEDSCDKREMKEVCVKKQLKDCLSYNAEVHHFYG